VSDVLIMRDRSVEVTAAEREAATKVLEKGLRGIDDKHHKRWRTFLRRVFSLEDGEIAEIATRIPRSGSFHRFHMAVEQAVFNGQEKFEHFEQFRNWLKVGAGFCDWVAGPKGGVIPCPRSISFADLEEDAMREFHNDTLAFLRGPHAAVYLWKHLGPAGAAEMMESILQGFDRA
jgi:hypothetical protein